MFGSVLSCLEIKEYIFAKLWFQVPSSTVFLILQEAADCNAFKLMTVKCHFLLIIAVFLISISYAF